MIGLVAARMVVAKAALARTVDVKYIATVMIWINGHLVVSGFLEFENQSQKENLKFGWETNVDGMG